MYIVKEIHKWSWTREKWCTVQVLGKVYVLLKASSKVNVGFEMKTFSHGTDPLLEGKFLNCSPIHNHDKMYNRSRQISFTHMNSRMWSQFNCEQVDSSSPCMFCPKVYKQWPLVVNNNITHALLLFYTTISSITTILLLLLLYHYNS